MTETTRLTTFKGGILDGSDIKKVSNYTVVAVTDSGKVFTSSEETLTFTLPTLAAGEVYTFVYTGSDGSGDIRISPAAANGINYAGTAVVDKDLILTKATAKKGDFVRIASLDATTWQVVEVRGTWAKEA